jgi:glutaredoxin
MRLKNYLKQNKIPFKEVNVASNKSAMRDMVRKSGQQGVPQLWINGRPVVGFDKPTIDRLLGL